jgi:hypothetical protein
MRILWLHLAAPAIVLVVMIIVVRRRLYREFPLFFSYLLYVVIATGLRTSVSTKTAQYFWFYWITEAIYGVAELLVIREVFRRTFLVEYVAHRWFRFIFPVTVIAILSLLLAEALYHPLGRGYISHLVNAIYWFDLGIHALEGTILLVLLGLMLLFPVSWRRYEFGVLTGFGVSASVTMLAYLLRFEWGGSYEAFFRYGPPVAYIAATLVWLHAFWRPPEPSPRIPIDPAEAVELMRYYRELLDRIRKSLGLQSIAFRTF